MVSITSVLNSAISNWTMKYSHIAHYSTFRTKHINTRKTIKNVVCDRVENKADQQYLLPCLKCVIQSRKGFSRVKITRPRAV